ncbi:MAG: redox-regulated ATPase YchF [Nitrospirota bacterium]
MRVAIIGLSNSGKTTIFNALTGRNLETTIYPTTSGDPHTGIVKVTDPRVDKLSEIFKPKKTTYATVEFIDYIGLTRGDVNQNRKVFDLIKDADALVHVVRAFEDDAVIHPLGNIDPRRDVETIELELLFGDLEFVEKRLSRMEEAAKKAKKPDEAERKLLIKCKEALENEIPLRDVYFSDEEKKTMRPLQFISIKPEIVVLTIGENDINTERAEKFTEEIEGYFGEKFSKTSRSVPVLTLCGKIEMEISRLLPDDAKLFLDDLGIKEPALNRLIRVCYDILGLISFFTYVGDEVRAWTISRGTNALKAAGKVHSDIERGFIRAEVVSFDDFLSSGSTHAAREKGLLRLEGKTYEVKDGDIINFRFNL